MVSNIKENNNYQKNLKKIIMKLKFVLNILITKINSNNLS